MARHDVFIYNKPIEGTDRDPQEATARYHKYTCTVYQAIYTFYNDIEQRASLLELSFDHDVLYPTSCLRMAVSKMDS